MPALPENSDSPQIGDSCPPSSDTPETDQLLECDQYKVDDDGAEYSAYRRMVEHAQQMERERNDLEAVNTHNSEVCDRLFMENRAMRDWIMQAAPILSIASCIVIDEAVERLGEIAGCRGVLELCPVDFISPENAEAIHGEKDA